MIPRLLSRGDAAEYCGMSAPHFDAHIAAHVPALDFGRKHLWDRAAIDTYLDSLSGLGETAFRISLEGWLAKIE